MIEDFRTWRTHRAILEATQELRFKVNHVYFGTIPSFTGTNVLSENRFYFCLDNCGRILWSSDGQERREIILAPGTLTFIPGGLELTYDFTPGRMAGFHFNLEIFPGLDVFSGEQICRQRNGQDVLCQEVLDRLNAGIQLSDTLRVHSVLFQAASDFCDVGFETLRRQVRLREKYAGLLAIVEAHQDAALTVGKLAESLGRTRDQLSKAFRRDLGFSLKHYLAIRLTREASSLLITGMNVRETANELGFSSEFYFSRFFKKQTGVTPSTYRKEYSG